MTYNDIEYNIIYLKNLLTTVLSSFTIYFYRFYFKPIISIEENDRIFGLGGGRDPTFLFYLCVHLVVDDEVPGLPPVPVPHGFAGRHHVLAHALGRSNLENRGSGKSPIVNCSRSGSRKGSYTLQFVC